MRDFLQKPGENDIVFLFFACHGAPDPNRTDNLYLLTHDTDPERIASTALPMREIRDAARENLRANKAIILADTCHSGGMNFPGWRDVGNSTTARINNYLQDLQQASKGNVIFTSAEKNQLSREGERWGGGHGVFTHYLLEGLRGKADRDQNGIVTLGELLEYVREQVRVDTDDKQHPSISTDFDRRLPITIVDQSKAIAAMKADVNRINEGKEPDSERGISYKRLEYFLSENKWFEADRETLSVMLRATGREMEGWLDDQSLSNFPSTELHIIDELWLSYSGGHFGFSLQHQIFESLSKKSLNAFGDAVGWRTKAGLFKGIFVSWKNYSELIFDLSAPKGHLPAWGQWQGKEVTEFRTVQTDPGGPNSSPQYQLLAEKRRIPLRDSYKIVFLRIQQSNFASN